MTDLIKRKYINHEFDGQTYELYPCTHTLSGKHFFPKDSGDICCHCRKAVEPEQERIV